MHNLLMHLCNYVLMHNVHVCVITGVRMKLGIIFTNLYSCSYFFCLK